jgi:hypothetical protein
MIAKHTINLLVNNPLVLPSMSLRSSSILTNPSKPVTLVVLNHRRNVLEVRPMTAIVKRDAMRQCQLGAAFSEETSFGIETNGWVGLRKGNAHTTKETGNAGCDLVKRGQSRRWSGSCE